MGRGQTREVVILIVCAVTGLALAAAIAVSNRTATPSVADPDAWNTALETVDMERAKALYIQTRSLPGEDEAVSCAVCHGVDGSGNYGIEDPRHIAPRLAGLNAVYVGEQLRLYATGRRRFALMRAMAEPLSAQDIADLATYVHDLKGPRGAVPAGATFEQLSLGRKIWIEGLTARAAPCADCHGADGAGRVKRSPEIAGEPVAYLERELRVLRDNGRTGTVAAETMTAEAHRLTDAEIVAVATYIGSIDPVSARPGSAPNVRH